MKLYKRLESEHSFCLDTLHLFEDLADYIWKARKQFNKLRKEEWEKLNSFAEEIRPLRWALESRRLDHIFPMTLHYSFVVLIFLEIENRLKITCDVIKQVRELPLRSKDLRGDTLEQCMLFLDKFVSIGREQVVNWQAISDLAKVRNCIVHTNGRVEDSKDKIYLYTLIKKHPEFFKLTETSLVEEGRLMVEHNYCFTTTAKAKDFFEDIFVKTKLMDRFEE
jgi:hypothetical protein